jgi:hypothetical protein
VFYELPENSPRILLMSEQFKRVYEWKEKLSFLPCKDSATWQERRRA